MKNLKDKVLNLTERMDEPARDVFEYVCNNKDAIMGRLVETGGLDAVKDDNDWYVSYADTVEAGLISAIIDADYEDMEESFKDVEIGINVIEFESGKLGYDVELGQGGDYTWATVGDLRELNDWYDEDWIVVRDYDDSFIAKKQLQLREEESKNYRDEFPGLSAQLQPGEYDEIMSGERKLISQGPKNSDDESFALKENQQKRSSLRIN
ncbi:hypothetical protein [Stenotrophomonas maltophilia]|uniref:hypothetical protein n=1 Tax=Stenotrophomonas maltophilia TaxID=40324 RepID=UPI0013FE0EB4|nr:hypothetical protein [Stenotrophomonas maltophilia]